MGADARARGVESSGAWGVDAAVGVPSAEASGAPRPGLLSHIIDNAAGLELFRVKIGRGAMPGARLTEHFWGLANRDGGEELALLGELRAFIVAEPVPWLIVDTQIVDNAAGVELFGVKIGRGALTGARLTERFWGLANRDGGDELALSGELRELIVAGPAPWLIVVDVRGFAKREGGDESVRNGDVREDVFE